MCSILNLDHADAIGAAFKDYRDRNWCSKLVIDASGKSGFLRELWRMNITAETLFPGMDGLGTVMHRLGLLLRPDKEHDYSFEHGVLAASVRQISPDASG